MTKNISIAIDGPAGAGKSTVAKLVARKLDLLYIDTGAMYRAITLMALRDRINLEDENSLIELAKNANIDFAVDSQKGIKVFLNDEDVTDKIRNPEVSRNVSRVARVPGVRELLAQIQRTMAKSIGVVMEGRDIGSTVLPKANFKFFLTASAQERARRRYIELSNQGYCVDLEQLIKEITERDFVDSTRTVAPLAPAINAEIIDCTDMGLEQVVDYILFKVNSRAII